MPTRSNGVGTRFYVVVTQPCSKQIMPQREFDGKCAPIKEKMGKKAKTARISPSGFQMEDVVLQRLVQLLGIGRQCPLLNYFFLAALALRFSSMAACAAARRATGTRYGEQLT